MWIISEGVGRRKDNKGSNKNNAHKHRALSSQKQENLQKQNKYLNFLMIQVSVPFVMIWGVNGPGKLFVEIIRRLEV